MNFDIVHELPERMRLRPHHNTCLTQNQETLVQRLSSEQNVKSVAQSTLTGSILIHFRGGTATRRQILQILSHEHEPEFHGTSTTLETRALDAQAGFGPLLVASASLAAQFILPPPYRVYALLFAAWPYLKNGLHSLIKVKINHAVLDAAAIAAAMATRDYRAASVICLLLNLGDHIECRARRVARSRLKAAFKSGPVWSWIRRGDKEERIKSSRLHIGDHVVVRAGAEIPSDGIVLEGEGLVQQASLTGEPLATLKKAGDLVLATAVVEEGELVIKVTSHPTESRAARIAQFVDLMGSSKGEQESLATRLADRLALPVISASVGTLLMTGNISRAVAVLLVDFSCAIKLSAPLAITNGLAAGPRRGFAIKGGKALEELARADTFILDKTGTLTEPRPSVSQVRAYHGFTNSFVLRHAACLEEHFFHPMGLAIVEEAERRKLVHDEEHSTVHYHPARGVESNLHGQRILVGNRRLLAEYGITDFSTCKCDDLLLESDGYHLVYVALGHRVIGLVALEASLRQDAVSFVRDLHSLGVGETILLTGDNNREANRIARKLDIDRTIAETLPWDKHQCIKDMHQQGRVICMVGDGMNDALALRQANVGIAMHGGSDLAKESADIILLNTNLTSIIEAKHLANCVMDRIKENFKAIIAINCSLIILGSMGLMPPLLSALGHNLATIGVALNSLRPYPYSRARQSRGGHLPAGLIGGFDHHQSSILPASDASRF